MAGEYSRAGRPDRINHEALRCLPGHLHPGRAQWHAADGKAGDASRLGGEYPPYVFNGHMTFEGHPVDQRGVA